MWLAKSSSLVSTYCFVAAVVVVIVSPSIFSKVELQVLSKLFVSIKHRFSRRVTRRLIGHSPIELQGQTRTARIAPAGYKRKEFVNSKKNNEKHVLQKSP